MSADRLREAYENCISILMASPAYHAHTQPCWCDSCLYIQRNVSEIRVIQKAALAASDAPAAAEGGEK